MSLPIAHRGGGGDSQPTARMESGRNKINHMTKPTGGDGGEKETNPGGGDLESWNIYACICVGTQFFCAGISISM